MKRFSKYLVRILVVILAMITCFSFAGCEDIKRLEVTVSVYETESKQMEEKTITVDLYRHLAKNTVDTVIKYVNEGYYDNALLYKYGSYSNQIMMGEYEYVKTTSDDSNGVIKAKDIKPQIKGEFDNNGVKGSNLLNKEGSISLWRTWVNGSDKYKTTDAAMNSGRATWFMPTSEITGYDKFFCVFAQIDLEDETNKATFEAIKDAFSNDDCTALTYTVYYTGTYDSSKVNENFGLEFHCIETSVYNAMTGDEKEDVFESDSEKGEYYMYDPHEIKVPVVTSSRVAAAVIKSIKVI